MCKFTNSAVFDYLQILAGFNNLQIFTFANFHIILWL